MSRRIIRVPSPEGGDERNVVWYRHHGCKNALSFRAALEDEDIDLLQWNLGSHGEGMPREIPFAVTATNPCNVCGSYPTQWFAWTGRLILP